MFFFSSSSLNKQSNTIAPFQDTKSVDRLYLGILTFLDIKRGAFYSRSKREILRCHCFSVACPYITRYIQARLTIIQITNRYTQGTFLIWWSGKNAEHLYRTPTYLIHCTAKVLLATTTLFPMSTVYAQGNKDHHDGNKFKNLWPSFVPFGFYIAFQINDDHGSRWDREKD